MPNHKFHGPWRSFVLVDDGTQIIRHDDKQIYLNIPNTQGVLENGSNHDGKNITGKVDDLGAGKFAVHLQETKTPFLVRHYEGVLIDDRNVLANGEHVLVVAGEAVTAFFVNSDFLKSTNPTAERTKRLLADDQNDGTWVMTKP